MQTWAAKHEPESILFLSNFTKNPLNVSDLSLTHYQLEETIILVIERVIFYQ